MIFNNRSIDQFNVLIRIWTKLAANKSVESDKKKIRTHTNIDRIQQPSIKWDTVIQLFHTLWCRKEISSYPKPSTLTHNWVLTCPISRLMIFIVKRGSLVPEHTIIGMWVMPTTCFTTDPKQTTNLSIQKDHVWRRSHRADSDRAQQQCPHHCLS